MHPFLAPSVVLCPEPDHQVSNSLSTVCAVAIVVMSNAFIVVRLNLGCTLELPGVLLNNSDARSIRNQLNKAVPMSLNVSVVEDHWPVGWI